MSSINKAIIIGNLGKDPEVKSFQNGGKICSFSVATSEKWKTKEGEQKEKTQWHNIVIKSDGLAGIAERFLRKGSKVYLEGQIETRKYQDQSGNDKYITEIVVSGFGGQLVMLDSANAGQSSGNQSQSNQGGDWGSSNNAPSQFGDDDLDDSVPF